MSWNKRDSRNQKGGKTQKQWRVKHPAIVVLAAVAIVALSVWWFLAPSGNAPTKDDVPVRRKPSAPTLHPTSPESPTPPALGAESPTNAVPKRMEEGVEVVSSTITTNSSGAIIEELVLADGKKMMKVQPPKPIFENACDQVIAMALSTKPGQSMPPLPNLDKSLEQDFINSLGSPIVISEDDSEEVKTLKAQVKEAKAYLVEEIKRGGSLLEALREHQAEMERNADSHLMAIQEMQKLRSEYGEDAAGEFIERVNESFRARGIPEIEFNRNKERGRIN